MKNRTKLGLERRMDWGYAGSTWLKGSSTKAFRDATDVKGKQTGAPHV